MNIVYMKGRHHAPQTAGGLNLIHLHRRVYKSGEYYQNTLISTAFSVLRIHECFSSTRVAESRVNLGNEGPEDIGLA